MVAAAAAAVAAPGARVAVAVVEEEGAEGDSADQPAVMAAVLLGAGGIRRRAGVAVRVEVAATGNAAETAVLAARGARALPAAERLKSSRVVG